MQMTVRVMVFIAIAMPWASPSRAAPLFIAGPFQDFKGIPGITTGCSHVICDTQFGFGDEEFRDQFLCQGFCPVAGVSVLGLAYLAGPTPNFNTGDLRITTIYGRDLNPTGQAFQVTGFNPIAPEVTLVPPETFFGNSGIAYTSDFFTASNLAELPALRPGFDLSPFQGDLGSIVYVFETTVPAADFAASVPEPSTWLMFGTGLTGLLGYSWRRKRRAA